MALVEIYDLIKIYKDIESDIEVPALRGIELSINTGELVGILGPSGAGKTTLLSIIGGLITPSSGEVIVDDKDIFDMTNKELINYRRKTIGFLWQLPEENLIPNITLLKNVILPMQIADTPLEMQKKQAQELLDQVGLLPRAHHKPHQISGGEAARASIAVALANKPLLLLGDQITGELDSETSQKVINYLRELNQDLGTTILIATHKAQFIDQTDHSYKIKDGRITNVLTSTEELKDFALTKEEYIFVDWQGNLRLPEEILTQVSIGNLVKAEVENGIIKLIPVHKKGGKTEKRKNKRRNNK
ncbi:MAG: ATP-binding cassette domain-containing protein [Candidatus Heimdallarchaeota archaeon]|nr:ATP-binding cassette domain-containing protein [Candidatus Heimdallarchaeota archaeon]